MRQFSTPTTTNVTLTTTNETVIATLTGVSTTGPGQTVRLAGDAQITTGTNTTALTLRVRRASVSGTLVGEGNAVQISAAAGSTEDHSVEVEEVDPGEFMGRTYVLTAQQTAATADGAVLQAELVCTVTP